MQHIVYPPRSHGRLGGKASGLFLAAKIVRRSPDSRTCCRRHPHPPQLVHPLGRHPRLHPPQRPRRRLQPQVPRPRPGAAGVPAHRPALQELVLLARDRCAGCPTSRRPRRAGRSSCAARACSRTGWDRPSPASTRASSSPTRAASATRLAALPDAIAEVYASVFSPDPIEYRTERGLLDLHEEMGILIQEVVGSRVGRYFLPAFSGVGFSNNEFRWSARIRREDGLLRIVPGLGHARRRPPGRRLPGAGGAGAAGPARQPDARRGRALLAEEGRRDQPRAERVRDRRPAPARRARRRPTTPLLPLIVSVSDHDRLRRPVGRGDLEQRSPRRHLRGALRRDALRGAHAALLRGAARRRSRRRSTSSSPPTARDVYLLQCRPQRARPRTRRRSDPARPPGGAVLFTARRYVSNGSVGDITPRRLRGPGGLRRPCSSRGALREVGARRRPAQPHPAQAPVHPHGPGPLGEPRRHPPGRAGDLRGHQQRGRARRDRAPEGRLRARPLLRHALLPGPRRVPDPLPPALPRRPRRGVQRGVPARRPRTPSPASPPSSRTSPASSA